jgi:hypothetical protein
MQTKSLNTEPTVALHLQGVFPGDTAGFTGKASTITTTTTTHAVPKPADDIKEQARHFDPASSLDELLALRSELLV